MPQIDYYFTLLSPYAYLAGPRFAAIVAAHGAEVRYFPVHFGSLAARMGSKAMTEASEVAVSEGLADPIRACGKRDCASVAGDAGLVLMWIAAILTALTGWDYLQKALPFLRDDS
jgi:2-hydroxychromene-2-carboxylate isomerase